MATTGNPRRSATEEITRQHLDELDQLMQRMLALPVDGLEDPLDAENGADFRFDKASLGSSAEEVRTSTPSHEPVPSTDATNQDEQLGEFELVPESTPSQTAPESVYESNPPEPSEAAGPVIQTFRPTRPPATPLPLRLVLTLNRAFDRCAGLFGFPGRWLRGPEGRTLLGWTGIALLIAAATWALLDTMGWSW
jgi:hypothetical protein